jgi:hypothetical protein
MPYLTRAIHNRTQHRNHQPRTALRNRLQNPHHPSPKLGPIQRHLPSLSPLYPRLLANIRHHCGKLTHFATTGSSAATKASISRLLPTQNDVR